MADRGRSRTGRLTAALRPAGPDDAEAVVALYDRALAWMVAHGSAEQWGTTPFSDVPRRVEGVVERCGSGGAWVGEVSSRVVGFLCVGSAPDYAGPATAPEVYVTALATDHSPQARGVGRLLLGHVDELARQRGVAEIRVDCWAGNGERLVRFYESAGYERDHAFTVGTWPGQVLRRPVPSR